MNLVGSMRTAEGVLEVHTCKLISDSGHEHNRDYPDWLGKGALRSWHLLW